MIPSLTTAGFAIAGLICALGPIIFHLLNRRRYRVVRWAAMDFLREALQRNRRVVEMRDIALLVLRTLAILLFGLALAQPFVARQSIYMWTAVFPAIVVGFLFAIVAVALWSSRAVRWSAAGGAVLAFLIAGAVFISQSSRTADDKKEANGSDPLHAVVIIDNSMSMGYVSEESGPLIRVAKQRARDFIDKLPEGSYVSIVPLCGSRAGISPDPYLKDDVLEPLDKIEVVDRSASLAAAANAAKKSIAAGPRDMASRVVFIGDQQVRNWQGLSRPEQFEDFPEMQVVDVSPVQPQNTWISDFRIEDGVADIETPTTFVVELRHEGASARENVQVTLNVNGADVASKSVSIDAGSGAREVRFEHSFNSYQVEPGKPLSVPVTASIKPDRLAADDQRFLVAHVVAALPVVFVDQYSDEQESAQENRFGETKTLRRLLAPVASRSDAPRQLVQIRHLRAENLNRDVLADARLVVIGGIADPGSAVPLLRQYVQQGGQLVIAAGAEFSPSVWHSAAWLDGAGILPAPLKAEPVGLSPEEAGTEIKPFFLSYESLKGHFYFQLADSSEDDLRALYSQPFFFKAAVADVGPEALASLEAAETKRLGEQFVFLAEVEQREKEASAKNGGKGTNGIELDEIQQQLLEIRPEWLKWTSDASGGLPDELPQDAAQREKLLEELVSQTRPRVLARFDNGHPYLVERRIGRGSVLFVSSGLRTGGRTWSTINKTDTVFIFDRILRSMVQSTLPQRNFVAQERLDLPMPSRDREVTLALWRPGSDESDVLDVGFIGKDQRGFSIERPFARGVYRVKAYDPATSAAGEDTPLWEVPLTINGEASESELKPLTDREFEQRAAGTKIRWVKHGDEISLTGAEAHGQSYIWIILVIAVLLFLLTELVILAWPAAKGVAPANGG